MSKTQEMCNKQTETEEQFADEKIQGGTLDGHEI